MRVRGRENEWERLRDSSRIMQMYFPRSTNHYCNILACTHVRIKILNTCHLCQLSNLICYKRKKITAVKIQLLDHCRISHRHSPCHWKYQVGQLCHWWLCIRNGWIQGPLLRGQTGMTKKTKMLKKKKKKRKQKKRKKKKRKK